MLDRLASIVRGQGKLCDIDEVGLDAVAFAQFTRDNARRRLMRPILAVPRMTGMNRFRLASIDLLLCEVPRQTSLPQHLGTQ